ncbi:hypothetical protein [Lactiplantibacillus pentosus]|nr:hypothetical protein [Lactiplantibacillus pentosus]
MQDRACGCRVVESDAILYFFNWNYTARMAHVLEETLDNGKIVSTTN